VKVFPENTLIISPVFVDPAHQGKGVATELIKQGITDLTAKGYKLGLEAQNPDNVKFYEKLGFRTIKKDYWKRENITNYYMMYQEDEQ
jgi:ribosomal protein S18 acetylase RimI-like enzyme